MNRRHAAADDRLGRPGRASCWPTTPRCTSATSAACRRARRSGCVLKRGLHRERRDENGHLIGDATDEVPQRGDLAPLPRADGGGVSAPSTSICCARSSSSSTARRASPDEHDYDAWEALWTDDAVYWVPAGGDDIDPDDADVDHLRQPLADRARAIKQLQTGKRHSQNPPSRLRRLISNVELLGDDDGDVAGGRELPRLRVARARHHALGRAQRVPAAPRRRRAADGRARRSCSSTTTGRCTRWPS